MYRIPSRKTVVLALWLGLLASPAIAAEKVDHATIGNIRSEAFNRSQVGKLLVELTEDVGPRLSASPADHKAAEWARGKFQSWGLANVHSEAFDEAYARGWQFRASRVEWVDSKQKPLHALPKAWTPGTNGPVEGEVELVLLKTKEDLEKYRGKLRGKILLLDDARKYVPGTEPDFKRHDEASLGELQTFPIPLDGGEEDTQKRLAEYLKRQELVKALNPFFVEEGVLATLRISDWDNGVLRVTGGGARKAGENPGVPELVVAAEHYNQLVRTVKRKQTVKLRLDVDAGFTSEDNQPAYNTFAELPGGAKKDEVVIIGAHIDSWHTGTGANDNGAGVVVMMEALRILKELGVTPKRTIRVALWSGEEQGLQGSSAYVKKYFAAFPEPTDPKQKELPSAFRESSGPLQRKAGYEKFAAYFNFDNGTGKIRGIYAQQNAAAAPIFKEWLEPFHDLGANTVTLRDTGSTDHASFDRVGLPGFQFVQDPGDYRSNVHHTHLDTFDHASIEDLKQAAAIVASFAWQAANRDEKLPRKPLLEK